MKWVMFCLRCPEGAVPRSSCLSTQQANNSIGWDPSSTRSLASNDLHALYDSLLGGDF